MRTVLVTGSAGFIGFHLSQLLLEEGFRVVGFDGMTDYYDVRIKQRRHQMLLQHPHFSCVEGMLEDFETLRALALAEKPDVIVHLAAQAGVRYSLENPRAYIDANLIGTFNVMECARELGVDHLLMASTSSVYGAETAMPFHEGMKVDTPLTLYAATKKANEAMAHSYAHLWNLPTTMFRFFTVYGPWGRPDMALFKFTRGILDGTPIDIYNDGEMYRDFTFVSDLVRGIRLLIDAAPVRPDRPEDIAEGDSLSPVAPFRVVNIGNGDKVRLAFWRYRLLSAGLILGAVVLLMISLFAQVAIGAAQQVIDARLPQLGELIAWLRYSRIVPALGLGGSLWVLFVTLTPRSYRGKAFPKWPGALFTTVWWVSVTAALPVVLRNVFSYDVTYGSLAGTMVTLFFFWLVGLGLVIGAQLNAALAEPEKLAGRPAEETTG